MGLARNPAGLQQLPLEHGPDPLRAIAAVADEPDAAARKPLDRRHRDALFETTGDYFPLAEREIDDAGQDLASRLAAASASRALE